MQELIDHNCCDVWELLKNKISNNVNNYENYLETSAISDYHYGCENHFLNKVKLDDLKTWCEEMPEKIPALLARVISPKHYDDQIICWFEIEKFLIEEYGSDEILKNIHHNLMGNIDYINDYWKNIFDELDILFKQFKSHKNHLVGEFGLNGQRCVEENRVLIKETYQNYTEKSKKTSLARKEVEAEIESGKDLKQENKEEVKMNKTGNEQFNARVGAKRPAENSDYAVLHASKKRTDKLTYESGFSIKPEAGKKRQAGESGHAAVKRRK